jgi:hypothetical protein
MISREDAATEVTDEILILGLVLVLTAAIFALLVGMVQITPKTPYLALNFSYSQVAGSSVIVVSHLNGDEIQLSGSAQAVYPVSVYIDTPVRSYLTIPDPATGSFRAGDRLYIYFNGTDFILTTDTATIHAPHALPSADLRVSFVDTRTNILIQGWGSMTYGSSATATVSPTPTASITVTATPTANITASPTATATATPTTNITATPTATATVTSTPTPTATTTTVTTTPAPSSYSISVSWVPKGTGANALGTVTPPGTNDATVTVATGSSQTFTATPASGYRIRFIYLDGVQVSSGGVANQVITYTVTNVQASHTLVVHFA